MNDDGSRSVNSIAHEPIEANVRAVWRTGAVIAAVVIASFVLVMGLMKWFAVADGGPPAKQQAKTDANWEKHSPLQKLRVREAQLLNQYQWVDSATGSARIPIDRAIEILSQNGLPASVQNPLPPSATPQQQPATSNILPTPGNSNEP